jgi:uncharacterized BrkB/YihY/UPF0761 family membrane protein
MTIRISKQLILSCLAFLVALMPLGLGVFVALSYLLSCPTDRPQCDLPDMAAFGSAVVLSPVLSMLIAFGLFRWLGRNYPQLR